MDYKIVADESVDFRIVIQLRMAGYKVFSIAEKRPAIKDEEVLSIAVENNALLITEDKDFGELVFRFRLKHRGILLIRIEKANQKIESTVSTLTKHYKELKDKFSVLNRNQLRIKS